MANPVGYIMSPELYDAVQDTGRDVRRNRATRKARRMPRRRIFSSKPCPPSFRIVVVGNPTTGDFELNLQIPNSSGVLTSDVLTIDWDATASDLETAIEGHAQWGAGDYEVVTADGPFPMHSLSFSLRKDLSSVAIPLPTVSNITLSGGARVGVRVERCDCEGAP